MKTQKNRTKIIVQLAMIFGIIACFTATSMAAANVKKGKRRYDEFCTPCHGKNGQGDGTRMKVEKFDPAPRNHTDGNYINRRTDVQLFKVVKDGGKSQNFSHIMPQWKHILKDKEIWNVVAYIRSLAVDPEWTGTPLPPDPKFDKSQKN